MTVELISVGTEILLGNIVNTNAAYLSVKCAELGLDMYTQTVVGDNDGRLGKVFLEAFERSDIVILGGGLGPTEDDLTKETVCRILGIELTEDIKARSNMELILKNLGHEPSANNYKQAMVPKDSIVLYNRNGTAPGYIIEKDGHAAILLPGPPVEMVPMFEEYVIPYLSQKSESVFYSVTIKECGIGESLLETKLLDLIDGQHNPTIATYAKTGCSEVRVTAKAESVEAAKQIAEPTVTEILNRLGDTVYTIENKELEEVVVELLKERNLTLSLAESCTGGLTASKIVNVSGASDVFKQSYITYSNEAKIKLLGVSDKTIEQYTAVSEETAKEMALGCLKASGADIALSVTGYAGPNDSQEEPKGLVYIACAYSDTVNIEHYVFNGNRQKIRESAAIRALNLIKKTILTCETKERN